MDAWNQIWEPLQQGLLTVSHLSATNIPFIFHSLVIWEKSWNEKFNERFIYHHYWG